MRLFHCDRCGSTLPFGAQACPACFADIGYVPDQRTLRVLTPTDDRAGFHLGSGDTNDDSTWWRCLNAAWGCNWMVRSLEGQSWCRSCRLTRGRPDTARPDAIQAWTIAEAAKRRLVHQLDEFALPIEIESESMPDGLVFDLVYLPGEGGITGHFEGVVTLDLAETEDAHRDELRRRLGEPFRTVIGHLRHEVAHFYWPRLVGQTDEIDTFRHLFGDDRADYRESIDHYYANATADWDRARYVTAYAAAHPFEDWAETFAHYLHIVDSIDTAVAYDLVPPTDGTMLVTDAVGALAFSDILDAWRPINTAVNAIAETVGAPAVYPFEPVGAVVDKLTFVHRQIAAHTERDRFYADQ